jgi:hypothetical protein
MKAVGFKKAPIFVMLEIFVGRAEDVSRKSLKTSLAFS